MSNLAQCVRSFFLFSKDSNGAFPNSPNSHDELFRPSYTKSPRYDLRRKVAPYLVNKDTNTTLSDDVEDFTVWKCPEVPDYKAPDLHINRKEVGESYMYFGGRRFPYFSISGGVSPFIA